MEPSQKPMLGLSRGAKGLQELLAIRIPEFHFACSSETWDTLKPFFPAKPRSPFTELITSQMFLDFHGVNIFIDESVERGQVEKRPGRYPPKDSHGSKE